MKCWIYILLIVIGFNLQINAQGVFKIDNNEEQFKLPFKLVNDLIIIPVIINGVELSFLLDTGVNSTVLFSLEERDSLNIRNATDIYLRGLGLAEPIRAVKSTGNWVRIGASSQQMLSLFVVFNDQIKLSTRLGIPVHGIIGYDFFKDFIVDINYVRKRLIVTSPSSYTYKRCGSCEDFPLNFYRNKPYLKVTAAIDNEVNIPMDLLIDSGSGDALWIFSGSEPGLTIPEKNFEDFLGYGMGGSVYGVRSRVRKLHIGKFNFHEVTTSFPDSLYVSELNTFEERNGTLGAQVLKRFNITVDYPGKKIRLKPNKYYRDPFEYDMSGLVIAHTGYQVIKDLFNNEIPKTSNQTKKNDGVVVYQSSVEIKFKLEPLYKIVEIRPNSPAEIAGLIVDDEVLSINGKPAYRYTLAEIKRLLSSKEGKRIKLKVKRHSWVHTITFSLKRIL